MTISETTRALLLGEKNRKVKEVKDTLARYFSKVTVVSEPADIDSSFRCNYLDLVVVTDSIREKDKLNTDFLIKLRAMFPQAKVLCLFDDITEDIEVILRSSGLIFLGSYKHFHNLSPAILQSAFGSAGAKGNHL